LLATPPVNRYGEGPVSAYATEVVLSGQKDPNEKFGVVILGGANAGAGAAGATEAAQRLGVIKAADAIYGISGGAFAAVYAATGQSSEAIKIYYRYLNTSRFYNPGRLLGSMMSPLAPPAVDVKYITDEVMRHEVPLDIAALSQSPIPIYGGAIDAITGDSIDFNLVELAGQTSGQHKVGDALRAGATLPIAGGRAMRLNRRHLYDRGVKDSPTALDQAIEDGCTRILILDNDVDPGRLPRIYRVGARLIRDEHPIVADMLNHWYDKFQEVARRKRERAINPLDNPTPGNPNIEVVSPGVAVSMFEKNEAKLRGAADAGGKAFTRHFPRLAQAYA